MAEAASRQTALWVVRRLRKAGYRALWAGGCVRDMLLHRRCTDYDVATDATPRQVKKLFGHVLLVGAKFGVAMVIHHGRKVEVATFRSDLSYSDGRRPDGVRFSSPQEDAQRRDFTINGMFYDPLAREVIDYVGGRADLAAGVLRTIGPPDQRFAEDYLRMLRAPRFAVRLGFRIDPATAAAVRTHAHKIVAISGERIFDELSKMLSQPSAGEAMERMAELGLAPSVLPELFTAPSLWPAACRRVAAVAGRKDLTLTLAALTADLSGDTIAEMVRRWGASNDLRDSMTWLAEHAGQWADAPAMPLAEFRRLAGHGEFPRLRVLWRVGEQLAGQTQRCARRTAARVAAIPGGVPLPEPFVKGADLLALGLPQGPRLGTLLREAYDEQLEERLTTREAAMAWAKARVERP
jgi:poly(A) polymerase